MPPICQLAQTNGSKLPNTAVLSLVCMSSSVHMLLVTCGSNTCVCWLITFSPCVYTPQNAHLITFRSVWGCKNWSQPFCHQIEECGPAAVSPSHHWRILCGIRKPESITLTRTCPVRGTTDVMKCFLLVLCGDNGITFGRNINRSWMDFFQILSLL